MHFCLEKRAEKSRHSLPSISVHEQQIVVIGIRAKQSQNPYCTVCFQCSRTPQNSCQKFNARCLGNCAASSLKFVPEILPREQCQNLYCTEPYFSSISVPALTAGRSFLLGSCANNKCRPYLPSRDLCNNKCSSIIVPTKIFSSRVS